MLTFELGNTRIGNNFLVEARSVLFHYFILRVEECREEPFGRGAVDQQLYTKHDKEILR